MSDLPTKGDTKNATKPTAQPSDPSHLESAADYKEPYSKRLKRYSNRNFHKTPIWIEAACALALVVITWTYTHYAGEQKNAMIEQLKQMRASLELQRHLAGDLPFVDLTTSWLSVAYDTDKKILLYRVAVRMTEGKTGAENIRVASTIDITDLIPTNYNVRTFATVEPSSLPPKTCRGFVLNTAVLWGRGARQLWIVDMDDATPEQKNQWTNKKHIVHEEDIISKLSSVLIGGDTILRDNPPSYPVQDGRESRDTPEVMVTVPFPTATN